MRRGFVPAVLLGVMIGAAESSGTGASVADHEMGLSKTGVFETPEPDRVLPRTAEPGEGPPVPRSPEGFPPRISHGIADFLPIVRGDNACLDCHAVDEKIEGEPTPIPPSHYIDWRNAPGETREEIAGARYYCVSCHVRVTSAPALVDNLYAD